MLADESASVCSDASACLLDLVRSVEVPVWVGVLLSRIGLDGSVAIGSDIDITGWVVPDVGAAASESIAWCVSSEEMPT